MKIWLLALILSTVSVSSAIAEETGPHARIEQATVHLLAIIQSAKANFDKDPQGFYRQVEEVIDPLIDFPTFTRSVMGPFGQRDYYLSLNAAQKTAYKADYSRFVGIFKNGLIHTYGKGLLAFSGQSISVAVPSDADRALIAKGEAVQVLQKVVGTEKTFEISYTMRLSKAGQWMVRNVSIEAINVGQLYQNQFVAAMKKHNNDFAQVVDNWVVAEEDLLQE